MAVLITDLCINCDACIDECPVSAIASEGDSPRDDWEYTYVKPEKCILVDIKDMRGIIAVNFFHLSGGCS